jgi:hypothetical protein
VERALLACITEKTSSFGSVLDSATHGIACCARQGATRAPAVLQYPDLLDLKLKSAGHDEWLLSGEAYRALLALVSEPAQRLSEEHHLHSEEKHVLSNLAAANGRGLQSRCCACAAFATLEVSCCNTRQHRHELRATAVQH